MEPCIQEHIAKLIAKIESFNGAAFDVKPFLQRSLAEIIVPMVLTGGLFATGLKELDIGAGSHTCTVKCEYCSWL